MHALPARGQPPAEPFFLDGAPGRRFCLFHPPAGRCCGAVLYIPPFAEEMNRARRMAALQARALAALGYGVLQLDLYGCGDSSGDFGDARWEIWKDDVARAAAWLDARLGQPLTLWGLRLGALLALDAASGAVPGAGLPPRSLLLWQPVVKASAYLTQFLRLRMANDLLGDGTAQVGTNALRAALRAGDTLEIAGYDLAPELAAALDTLAPLEAMTPPCPVHWFEALGSAGQALPPAAERVAAAWRERGVALRQDALQCPPFWTTAEIAVSPALLEASADAIQGIHGH